MISNGYLHWTNQNVCSRKLCNNLTGRLDLTSSKTTSSSVILIIGYNLFSKNTLIFALIFCLRHNNSTFSLFTPRPFLEEDPKSTLIESTVRLDHDTRLHLYYQSLSLTVCPHSPLQRPLLREISSSTNLAPRNGITQCKQYPRAHLPIIYCSSSQRSWNSKWGHLEFHLVSRPHHGVDL